MTLSGERKHPVAVHARVAFMAALLIPAIGAATILAPHSSTQRRGVRSERPSARPDILIADFEGDDYGNWKVEGTAFGTGPARGTLPNQMPVTGYRGRGLVNSYVGGDGSTGRLTSPVFVIERPWINFLIGGGKHPGRTCINLLVDGAVVRTATGPNDRPGGSERLQWTGWHVAEFLGRQAQIEILDMATEGWGHINVDHIVMSDHSKEVVIRTDVLLDETYRPQFHFTPLRNWTNDPNGLVYYKGEYHLFFQHNPYGNEWGNMTWGHAVSRDLVHWKHLPNAIEPDELGTIFSGSAVVDHLNTTGVRRGSEKPIVAIYTAAGGTSEQSRGKPFTQCIAYSLDRGRTWTKYSGNPVLGHIDAENRDPKVTWHAPTRSWIMALYLTGNEFALFRSPNLLTWEQLHTVTMPECAECPDFFEMPVERRPNERKWVFTAANGRYLTGDFDGKRFVLDGPPRRVDYGANFYAVQTYSDIPPSDGRRIQIAWMAGGVYPGMPFNQQMSFPCTLTLRETPDGLRLCRWPVREIARLYERKHTSDLRLNADQDVVLPLQSELWDMEADIYPQDAEQVILTVRGEALIWDASSETLSALGHTVPLPSEGGLVRLRLLVDRTSLEVFGNGGIVSATHCVLFHPDDRQVSFRTSGGAARVRVRARTLRSVWRP